MIILVFTRTGFDEMLPCITAQKPSVWVGGDVLTADELRDLRAQGIDLTNFSYSICPEDSEAVADALATIYEHHPNQTVWVERRPQI